MLKILKQPRFVILSLALGIYILQSIATPLFPGRDCASYLLYYLEMKQPNPIYESLMLFRTPGAPLFHGLLLDLSKAWLGNSLLDEILQGILFCLSALIVYKLGALWSSKAGLFAASAVILQPGYGLLYHSVSSDGVFAAAFLGWVYLIFKTYRSPKLGYFALHGLALSGLVLIRPSSQFLLPFIFFPWFLRLPFWERAWRFLLCTVTLSLCLAAWSSYNYLRYDDFTISRGGFATLPLTRIFLTGQPPIKASNGPASAALFQAIQNDLLQRQPYLAYGIDLGTFLNARNLRMLGDLISLADRTWGWQDDHHHLFQVGLEAIRSNPMQYLRSVARTVGGAFLLNLTQATPTRQKDQPEAGPAVIRDSRNLPVPSEGQLIPASNLWWLASSPDQKISYDWKNYFQTGRLEITDPTLKLRDQALHQRLDGLMELLPARDGSPLLANIFNIISKIYPPMILWVLAGIIGWVFKPRQGEDWVLGFVLALAFTVLLGTYAGIFLVLQYRIPFDPLFILAGTIGGKKLLVSLKPLFYALERHVR